MFYKPAPTIKIHVQAKTDHPLRPGIFLDYYIDYTGKFTGQYLCCDLEDFVHKNLHHRTKPENFKLHIHRTEVCRDPVGAHEPIFPLLRKYYECNYTVEGLEGKHRSIIDSPMQDYQKSYPPVDQGMIDGSSYEHASAEADFKYSIDGRKLRVAEDGTAIRRTANWRPHQVPIEWW